MKSKRRPSKSKTAAPINQEAIMTAAIRLFRSKGYHATSMQDIADEVGLLKGSLYHHIDSKEALMLAVLRRSVRDVLHSVKLAAAGDGTARQRLSAAIKAEIEAMAKHQDEILIWFAERGRLTGAFAEVEVEANAVDEVLFKIIQQGIREGIWSARTHRLAARAIFGMMVFFPTWYREGGHLSAAYIAEQFYLYADRILSTDAATSAPAR
jgi:TetR/AcrR family transcriptional regulator, cholesterol catabolism regulator